MCSVSVCSVMCVKSLERVDYTHVICTADQVIPLDLLVQVVLRILYLTNSTAELNLRCACFLLMCLSLYVR